MAIFENIIFVFVYLFLIVLSCALFTNSIEHLGKKLNFNDSATGSILAAVGTALPETILPLIAIFSAGNNLKDGVLIGTGAILGSSFLLSTLALFISGATFIVVNKNDCAKFLNLDFKSLLRDCKYFLTFYMAAVLTSFIKVKEIKIFVGILLIFLWFFYAIRTIKKQKTGDIVSEDFPLYFAFKNKNLNTNVFLIIFQTLFSLVCLFISSKFFIGEIQYFSVLTGLSPLIVSLFLSPVATELPEITNSVLWIKNKKDELAISNITGALVYQASIVTAMGLIFTNWKFGLNEWLNIFCTASSVFVTLSLLYTYKKASPFIFVLCLNWYLAFLCLIFCFSLR